MLISWISWRLTFASGLGDINMVLRHLHWFWWERYNYFHFELWVFIIFGHVTFLHSCLLFSLSLHGVAHWALSHVTFFFSYPHIKGAQTFWKIKANTAAGTLWKAECNSQSHTQSNVNEASSDWPTSAFLWLWGQGLRDGCNSQEKQHSTHFNKCFSPDSIRMNATSSMASSFV